MCILTTQRRKGSLDGAGAGEGRVNLKLQEAEATKIKILGVGVGAALDVITLDEGQRYSICLVL